MRKEKNPQQFFRLKELVPQLFFFFFPARQSGKLIPLEDRRGTRPWQLVPAVYLEQLGRRIVSGGGEGEGADEGHLRRFRPDDHQSIILAQGGVVRPVAICQGGTEEEEKVFTSSGGLVSF